MKFPFTSICLTFCMCLSLNADDSDAISSDGASQPPKVAASPESCFPHEASDLKPDPAAVWGSLDNGLRYVILPHRGQPGRASLRLYINIGSAVEGDDQQGMAHFLEHMAFNGTRNFPAGESLKYFQRLGMAFVAHTNAATGLDSTVYKLELPRVEDDLAKQSLTFFRDVLDGMNLDEQEIEQERRVILSEMLARNSANYRSTVAGLQFALPDSKYSHRMPIGTTDCIRGMSRKQFINFYETWYTPARATIVAAGDLNADKMRRLIEQHFQDAKARRGETANPSFGEIATGHGVVARLHTEKEASATTISLSINRPHFPEADTAKRQRKELVRALANLMLSTRFEKLAVPRGQAFKMAAPVSVSRLDLSIKLRRRWSASRSNGRQRCGYWSRRFAAPRNTALPTTNSRVPRLLPLRSLKARPTAPKRANRPNWPTESSSRCPMNTSLRIPAMTYCF